MSPEESMIQAGERRLRPIMMTALATVAGMIRWRSAGAPGSQMLQPLAIAVIGGIWRQWCCRWSSRRRCTTSWQDAQKVRSPTRQLSFLDSPLPRRSLVRGWFVRRLQSDEPCRERFTTALVEVNDRVVFVDFDERARP